MLKLGPIVIFTRAEYNVLVKGAALAYDSARGRVIATHQDLLRAAMAADAHLHEHPANPDHEAHRLAVCEQLVAAIGAALTPGAHP